MVAATNKLYITVLLLSGTKKSISQFVLYIIIIINYYKCITNYTMIILSHYVYLLKANCDMIPGLALKSATVISLQVSNL